VSKFPGWSDFNHEAWKAKQAKVSASLEALRPRPENPRAYLSPYQAEVHTLCDLEGIAYPIFEYRFYALRKWRFDAAWPDKRCALEIEGGVWANGRHTRGSGFVKDMEKYNAAVLQGWRVIRCLPDELKAGISQIAMILTRAA